MASAVLFEVAEGDGWRIVLSLPEESKPGSLASYPPSGREVYIVGWREEAAGVWRANREWLWPTGLGLGGLWRRWRRRLPRYPEGREVLSAGLDLQADLATGPYQLDIVNSAGATTRFRFTLVPDPAQ